MRRLLKVVWAIQQHGRKEWKQQSGYHRRSLVENGFYRYKQLLGDRLSSRQLPNQCAEVSLSKLSNTLPLHFNHII